MNLHLPTSFLPVVGLTAWALFVSFAMPTFRDILYSIGSGSETESTHFPWWSRVLWTLGTTILWPLVGACFIMLGIGCIGGYLDDRSDGVPFSKRDFFELCIGCLAIFFVGAGSICLFPEIFGFLPNWLTYYAPYAPLRWMLLYFNPAVLLGLWLVLAVSALGTVIYWPRSNKVNQSSAGLRAII